MKNTVSIVTSLILAVAALSLPVLAQDHQGHGDQHGMHSQKQKAETLTVGKKGEVHFTSEVKAGDTVLKSGMYQVQHLTEGEDHVIVFKEMGMGAGYKMGNTPVGKEVARLKCIVEPVEKKVSNTKITLRTNNKGEKELAEIQVAGEAFKHRM
ncbi:MAG TPA: hypothetical protein VGB07_20140 [Blastocatellia bacterium]|jgi:hypothetical protein